MLQYHIQDFTASPAKLLKVYYLHSSPKSPPQPLSGPTPAHPRYFLIDLPSEPIKSGALGKVAVHS